MKQFSNVVKGAVKKIRSYCYQHPILIIGLISLILFTSVHDFNKDPYQSHHYLCLTYIQEGTLYSGQLHCHGTILVYYIPYLIKILFGAYFGIIMHLLDIGLHTATILVMVAIVRSLIRRFPNILLFLSLYVVLLYLPVEIHSESLQYVLFANLFLLLGFYTLYCTQWRYKATIAILFFLISFLNRITTLFGIFLFLGWYVLSSHGQKKWSIKASFQFLKELFPGIILVAVILFFLTFSYPLIWDYMVFMHMGAYSPNQLPFLDTIHEIFSFPPSIRLVYVFFMVELVLLYFVIIQKEYKLYILYPLLGWPFLVYELLRYHAFREVLTSYHLPVIPFIIISLLYVISSYSPSRRSPVLTFLWRSFISIVVILVIFNFFSVRFDHLLFKDLYAEKQELQDAVLSGIQFIQLTHGSRILVESPELNYTRQRMVRAAPKFAHFDFVEIHTNTNPKIIMELFDAQALKKLLGNKTKRMAVTVNHSQEFEDIIQQIKSSGFDAIVSSPPQWANTIAILDHPEVIPIYAHYCTASFPDFEFASRIGRNTMDFYIINQSLCQLSSSILSYYWMTAKKVCSQSKVAADIINKFLVRYGAKPYPCEQNTEDFVDRFARHTPFTYEVLLVFILVVINLGVSVYQWQITKK